MRALSVVLLSVSIFMEAACAPYTTSFRHVYFDENARATVVERDSGAEQAKVLFFVRQDVPLKVRVVGNGYTLEIWTPLSGTGDPVVGLRAVGANGATLFLDGAHVLMLDERSGGYLRGWRYVFLVDDAGGRPLQVQIKDAEGRPVGNELLPYSIRSRGRFFGITSL